MRTRALALTFIPALLLTAAGCSRGTSTPTPTRATADVKEPKRFLAAPPPASEPAGDTGAGATKLEEEAKADEKAVKKQDAEASRERPVTAASEVDASVASPAAASPATGRLDEMGSRAEADAPAGAASDHEEASVSRRNVAQALPLRAGSTDDNEDFDEYLGFLDSRDDFGLADYAYRLDVRERSFLRVQGPDGRPVPGARVAVIDEDRDAVVWSATTYGDGRVPFYPRIAGGEQARFVVEVSKEGRTVRSPLSTGTPESLLTLASQGDGDVVRLDVLFVIDTTGSMGDEIDRIKQTLLAVTTRLRGLSREMDLRYGAVLYRDHGDAYVTRIHPFTGDIEAFDRELQQVRAGGGGDTPEALDRGLADAVNGVAWRDGAAHVAFLIADAPPHMDDRGDVPYDQSLKAALAKGIRIHAVAASGLDDFGTLVFRQIAQFTRGKFVFIEYGTSADSAASHGVTGYVSSNNLDDILYEQIAAEAAGWGRDV